MGQVPVLQVGETKIVQSKAIERFLARKLGFYGKTEEEGALIDSLGELLADLKTKWSAAKEEEPKAAFFATELPKQLAFVEKLYGSSSQTTLFDIQLYHLFTHYLSGEAKASAEKVLAGCPLTAAKVEAVKANADVAKWEADRPSRGEPF